MEVRAESKFVRISPQKVRMVAHAVKGKNVETGLNLLKFMPQKAARIVKKTVQSALGNANKYSSINVDSLLIKNVIADPGPTLKRFSAKARGRGTRILKRTSHITVVLSE